LGIKVNVNWPEDMEQLEDKAAEALASILSKKLQPREVEKLITSLKDNSISLRL
jgi:hypothetical protein